MVLGHAGRVLRVMGRFSTARLVTGALICAGVTVGAQTAAEAMSVYRWKNRPLLVFAPSAQSAQLARQRAILSGNSAGLRDRDMVVIYVIGNRVRAQFGRGPGMGAAALRRRYGVPRDQFRAILVGKDTGAKLSSRGPVSVGRIFRLIDSMPMRQREMRGRS